MHKTWLGLSCWLALLSIADAQTNFLIQSIVQNPDRSVSITWPAVPQWTYEVMFANLPGDSWQELPDGQLSAGASTTQLCFTDTTAAAVSQRFYKVGTTSRAPVTITLVLDRSASMNPSHLPPPSGDGCGTGGGVYLPGAVSSFLGYFSDTIDEASMVSFGSTATVNIPMAQPFKSDIATAVSNLFWCGGAYSVGGLTNALLQEESVTIPANQQALQVVVFFTDGLPNMIEQSFVCSPTNAFIFGGMAGATPVCPAESGVFFFGTNTPYTCSAQEGAGGYGCYVTDNGSINVPGTCSACPVTQFWSTQNSAYENFTRSNVTAEAQYQAIQIANVMRNENMVVCSIGFEGFDLTMDFLAQVANATNSPAYNPCLPTGQAVLVSGGNLQAAFQQVASQILSLAAP